MGYTQKAGMVSTLAGMQAGLLIRLTKMTYRVSQDMCVACRRAC